MKHKSNPQLLQDLAKADLPRVDAAQYRQMRKLVRECCNYDAGDCLILDECPCVQSISYSLNCKWFRSAVLPLDKTLEAELLQQTDKFKNCVECNERFVAASNRSKYCPKCAKRTRRKKEASRQRELYKKSTHLEIEKSSSLAASQL